MVSWNLQDDAITLLLPVTKDPFMLGCFGWNIFDWVAFDPSALSHLLASQHVKYHPTSPAARKSQVRNICTLARSMLQSRVATDIRLCFLGPCLLMMHDTVDAEQAY